MFFLKKNKEYPGEGLFTLICSQYPYSISTNYKRSKTAKPSGLLHEQNKTLAMQYAATTCKNHNNLNRKILQGTPKQYGPPCIEQTACIPRFKNFLKYNGCILITVQMHKQLSLPAYFQSMPGTNNLQTFNLFQDESTCYETKFWSSKSFVRVAHILRVS